MMIKTAAFEAHTEEYEAWYNTYNFVYESELLAIKELLPKTGMGIEIGVGTGRFAYRLGIKKGVEPVANMGLIAKERGIEVISALAEALPISKAQFDYVLFVTIEHLADPEMAFKEAHRILKPGGALVVAFIDKNRPIGLLYEKNRNKSIFYKDANFYSVDEVLHFLEAQEFSNFEFVQTLFGKNLEECNVLQRPVEGYGKRSFVVVRAYKETER